MEPAKTHMIRSELLQRTVRRIVALTYSSLDALAKQLRKVTVGFVMSVYPSCRLSAHMEHLNCH